MALKGVLLVSGVRQSINLEDRRDVLPLLVPVHLAKTLGVLEQLPSGALRATPSGLSWVASMREALSREPVAT